MNETVTMNEKNIIFQSTDRAIQKYIDLRYAKIPEFVNKYFTFKGALKLNRKALGLDLVKGPFNIFWSLPYTGLKATSSLLRKLNAEKISSAINKIPQGFETNVQKEVVWLIYTELLEIPYSQSQRSSTNDALFEEILNQPEISELFLRQLTQINLKSQEPAFRLQLENNLSEYASSRTAAADLAGTIIALSVGTTVFKKMTPGAMATGTAVASAIAQKAAITNFVLGPTLGSLYYSIFPVPVSMGLLIASIGSIMAALALVTSFAGIITDPIQAKLGIHQRRLHKFINCLENELKGKGETKFEIKDRYVARVFDFLDMLKTAAAIVI